MCIVFLYFPPTTFLLGMNRDEEVQRPTKALQEYHVNNDSNTTCYYGMDCRQEGGGGTWLGITNTGRFAFLTNIIPTVTGQRPDPNRKSRGELVNNFLASHLSPEEYLQGVTVSDYNPFNLCCGVFKAHGGGAEVYILDPMTITRLQPNMVHGCSNHYFSSVKEWPKVTKGKQQLSRYLQHQQSSSDDDISGAALCGVVHRSTSEQSSSSSAKALLEILSDNQCTKTDDGLPHLWRTAIRIDVQKVEGDSGGTVDYGTRTTTVISIDQGLLLSIYEHHWDLSSLQGATTTSIVSKSTVDTQP